MTRRRCLGARRKEAGTAAMAGLMRPDAFGAAKGNAKLNGGLHHVAKAKRVIYLFRRWPSHRSVGLQTEDAGNVRQGSAQGGA